jgi:hypothetical protein
MEPNDVAGDVVLTGDKIAEFCDLLDRLGEKQSFDIARLRSATRLVRRPSLGESEWRVTLSGQRGVVVVPIKGV